MDFASSEDDIIAVDANEDDDDDDDGDDTDAGSGLILSYNMLYDIINIKSDMVYIRCENYLIIFYFVNQNISYSR